jgi:hypothetical protein
MCRHPHFWHDQRYMVCSFLCAVLLTTAVQISPAATLTCAAGDVACLIAAIHIANSTPEADTIQLTSGTYTLTTVDNMTDGANGLPSITSALTIQGVGADQTIVERGVNAPQFRVVHVSPPGTLALHALTIRGGECRSSSCAAGAGLYNQQGTITLTQSVMARNRAGLGAGGLITHGGTVTITDSLIADNAGDLSDDGGGLANYGGTVHIMRSLVLRNHAFHEGGGLYNEAGMMTLTQTTIAENTADATGGLFIRSGTVTVSDSAIVDNFGSYSGANGIYNEGMLTLTNSTVAHNYGYELGGALLINGGTTRILNSTVAENSLDNANSNGGGILTLKGVVELQNTILARNTVGQFGRGPDCYGAVVSLGHNLVGDPTACTITLQATDRTGDPGLGEFTDNGTPGNGHFPLLSTSAAVDAGDPAACPPQDQLDDPRVGTCDIGAVEFQSLPALALGLNQTNFRPAETLRISLHAQNPGPALTADFYFAAISPDDVTTFFITRLSPLNGVWARLDDPRGFQPLAANVALAEGFDITFDPLLEYTFSGGETPGTYRMIAALTPPGALGDGKIDQGDVLALAVEAFRLSPGPSSSLVTSLPGNVQAIRDRHMKKAQ